MPDNYILLEKVTVGAAGAASVTFANIPQTGYTDLVVNYSMRTNRATVNAYPAIRFNGNASSYSQREVFGTGSGAFSSSGAIIQTYAAGNGATSNTFGSGSMYIPNYTSSNFKSVSIDAVGENNGTEGHGQLLAGLWSNTAAITSITILAGDGSTIIFGNSTFYLYGVATLGTTPVIAPKATGGDIIDTDGTYWYHTFISSGTFTPTRALNCDYLVVAGGGGGGSTRGGGGGAGGLRSTVTATGGGGSLESALSLASNTNYTVTIGAGGAGNLSGTARGISGSNSVLSTITSTGGGGGGTASGGVYTGLTGGSGGGAGDDSSGPYAGGSGTANQGYAGGTSTNIPAQEAGGGGGGAGAVGANAVSSSGGKGGNGGNGIATVISGTSTFYAGGGGGGSGYLGGGISAGTGGNGGGGAGALYGSTNAVAATFNSGGGGGAGTYNDGSRTYGANGGSGIVIVRYAV